ncbi:hypothetical protein CR513_14372, partial [Mucuna pruriens]
MTKTMLNNFNSPKYFWAKVVNDRQSNISYFHHFRCDCFILNTKDNLSKIHTYEINDSKPNKELSELIESFVELNIKDL